MYNRCIWCFGFGCRVWAFGFGCRLLSLEFLDIRDGGDRAPLIDLLHYQ